MEEAEELLEEALTREKQIGDLIIEYATIDGEWHKQWVIDQILRVISGVNYQSWIDSYFTDVDGVVFWDAGIEP